MRPLTTGLLLLLTSICSAQQLTTPKPPGRLIDVGGHRLHMNCQGKGDPTVVMESGAGDFSFDWALVQPEVARFTRVCTYDRAGYAWSEPGPTPRTLGQIAYELRVLIKNAGIRGPVLLVGHSLGGLIVRRYASEYSKDVAGIVFVDAAHEEQLVGTTDRTTGQGKIVQWLTLSQHRLPPPIQTAMPKPSSAPAPKPASTPKSVGSPFDKLPGEEQKLRLWAVTQPNFIPARISEFDFLADELEQLHTVRQKPEYPLGNLPVIVLTAGVRESSGSAEDTRHLSEDHTRLQNDLAELSRNAKHLTSPVARHHIQIDDPQLVIESIRELVNTTRSHRR
jgi:pimeloyl-ACP methyl ester carboxylesterase